MEAMKPIKVYSSAERIEADMLVEALKNNKISAYRQGVGSGAYMDICSGYSVFGEEIYVDEADVQAAKEIIHEIVGNVEAESGENSEQPGIGRVGDLEKMKSPVRIFALLAAAFLILSVIFSIVKF